MRIYLHFEEEEPNHTAVLNFTSTETTFKDLLEQFVAIYNERFGEALDADTLDLKNSKKKKMKRDDSVAGVLQDKDDLFITKGTATKKATPKAKPAAKPQPVPSPTPATQAPVPRPADIPATRRAAQEETSRQGYEEDAAHTGDLTEAVARGIAALPTNDRFRFAQDRMAAACEEDGEMDMSSPVPTHEHNVQTKCLKCLQHMFYKSVCSLVSCPHCSFLHVAIECPKCGTFFPAGHEQDPLGCPMCKHVDSMASFRNRQKLSFSKSASPPLPLREANEIHIVTQYYVEKKQNSARQREIDECLRKNISNKYVRHVHVLTEEPLDLNRFQLKDKLVQHVQGNWLKYSDAILYAQRFLMNKVVIIANADIYMDDSLQYVKPLDMTGRCLALTRHDVVVGQAARFNAGAAPISQDAWVFKSPLPDVLMQTCNFLFGKPGCDNRFAFELRSVGMRVTNPCFRVIANHLHESELRNYVHGKDTVLGAYAAVIPVMTLK